MPNRCTECNKANGVGTLKPVGSIPEHYEESEPVNARATVFGTLHAVGTLRLDEAPILPAGSVRVTVETLSPPIVASRFWTMMETIWANLEVSGTVPRSAAEVEEERRNFRDDWDERQVELEQISDECDSIRQAGHISQK